MWPRSIGTNVRTPIFYINYTGGAGTCAAYPQEGDIYGGDMGYATDPYLSAGSVINTHWTSYPWSGRWLASSPSKKRGFQLKYYACTRNDNLGTSPHSYLIQLWASSPSSPSTQKTQIGLGTRWTFSYYLASTYQQVTNLFWQQGCGTRWWTASFWPHTPTSPPLYNTRRSLPSWDTRLPRAC